MSLSLLAGLLAWVSAVQSSSPEPGNPARTARVIVAGIDRDFGWREPFRPEPWWPIGGAIFRYFDHDIIVASGANVPNLVERIERRLDAGGFSGIYRIEFWTHGGPGYFRIQDRRWFADLFGDSDPAVRTAMQRLRERLVRGGVVHFRSCSTFHGRGGRRFASDAQRFFNETGKPITIMGHTRPTGLTHPGWQTLPPGGDATWSGRDGETESALEGVEILGRDLLRIFSGGIYEAAVHVHEKTLPRCAATIDSALRYNGWTPWRTGP